jgi:hypothetical protein
MKRKCKNLTTENVSEIFRLETYDKYMDCDECVVDQI